MMVYSKIAWTDFSDNHTKKLNASLKNYKDKFEEINGNKSIYYTSRCSQRFF